VSDGLRVEAGPSIVVVVEGEEAAISCFRPNEPDLVTTVVPQVENIIQAIVECGGGYPDIIQFLQQATSQRKIGSRLAFDAIPTEFDGRLSVPRGVIKKKQDLKKGNVQDSGDDDSEESEGYWPSLFDTALLEFGE
jgi:hypothetical protein